MQCRSDQVYVLVNPHPVEYMPSEKGTLQPIGIAELLIVIRKEGEV
jgi:hypothetical protein